MEDSEELEDKTKCQTCVAGFKHVLVFILSHLGLLTLVISYCAMGAFVFTMLEAENEENYKKEVIKMRENVSEQLWVETQRMEYINQSEWIVHAEKTLKEFEAKLIDALTKQGWNGDDTSDNLTWTPSGSFFYSIITITTIGYGNMAPKTVWGKIFTIFYAIVGIPLMVICWSHIGDFMAKFFRLVFWKVCCYLCTRRAAPRHRSRSQLRRGRSVRGQTPRGNTSIRMKQRSIRRNRISQRSADSQFSDSVSAHSEPGVITSKPSFHYSSTLPRTTQPKPGGGRVPQSPSKRFARSAEPEFGPGIPVLYNKYAEDVVALQGEKSFRITRNQSVPPELIKVTREEQPMEYWDEPLDEYDDSDFENEDNITKRPVPIWMCTAIVIGYIVGGAFLFKNYQGWGLLDSAYFCFITLTTIGFGDFVPQMSDEKSIAICAVYILFGIALLAMSFNLVQEQVINSAKELAITVGIIDDEEDQ